MTNLSKLLDILTFVLIGLSVIFMGIFYFGGEIPDQAHETPVYTDLVLHWTKALFFVAVGLSVIFPIVQLVMNPKGAIKSLLGVFGLAVIIGISYAISDGTLLNLPGYTGTDNVYGTLKFADTVLYTMYILGFGAILSIAVTEAIRAFR
ncbi:MAG: hypothetical protein N4A49_04020 [Marinifilaceae bacterium]|jgi:hypothetical protein|nr:hypothetical protein [Marinifilaceae bacterium]